MIKKDDVYISDYEYLDPVNEYSSLIKIDRSFYTVESYLFSIDRFFDFIGVKTLEDIEAIKPSDIRKYQIELRKTLQPSSVNANIRPTRAFFNWMLDNGYIKKNPFPMVKNIKEVKKNLAFLAEDEIVAMFNACKNIEEKAIFSTLIYLGLRRSELVNLKVEDIDGNKVKIMGKGAKGRVLFLAPDALRHISEYLNSNSRKKSAYVFPSSRGNNYTPEAIRLKVNRLAERAGINPERIKDITPHAIRRTFATNLVEDNINMAIIQRSMGHSDIATTMRYAHIRDSAVESAMIHQRNFSGD